MVRNPSFPMFVIFLYLHWLTDLPEAEAELVAGYQTQYSGMMYAMFG